MLIKFFFISMKFKLLAALKGVNLNAANEIHGKK